MKREEFISSLKSLAFCKGLVTAEKLENTNEAGDKFYRVNVRLVKDNVIEYRDIQYVIVGEGTPEEEVYYLDAVPTEASLTVVKQLATENISVAKVS